jgi:hypothetical protein
VLAELKGVGGKVLQTSFDRTRENALRVAIASAGVGQPIQLKHWNTPGSYDPGAVGQTAALSMINRRAASAI